MRAGRAPWFARTTIDDDITTIDDDMFTAPKVALLLIMTVEDVFLNING